MIFPFPNVVLIPQSSLDSTLSLFVAIIIHITRRQKPWKSMTHKNFLNLLLLWLRYSLKFYAADITSRASGFLSIAGDKQPKLFAV